MWLLRSPNVRSIANKLRRQGVRLSEMYDIAGCRLIVSNLAEQDRVVQRLQGLFDATRIVDRREQPSYGYRAVHVIVRFEGRLHEIQITHVFATSRGPSVREGRGRGNMIFLVEYDRSSGRTITFRSFEDSQLGEAQDSRLDLELSLHAAGIDREVVLLDAANEAMLHRTHARYFHESVGDLARAWEVLDART